jgi:hypothetical protein
MNPKIKDLIDYLPSKEVDKALKYYENNEIELLKELIETSIFEVQSSLNAYDKHSKYYNNINIEDLDELLSLVEKDYYECLDNLDYLHECEKREFDNSYLEYE